MADRGDLAGTGRADRLARTEALVSRLSSLERELDALLGIDPAPAQAGAPTPGKPRGGRSARRDGDPNGPAIGRRIREARLGRGLTQVDLAEATGIRRPNVARLERGANTPTLRTLQRIAEALGTDVPSLVSLSPPSRGGERKKKPAP